MGGKTNCMPFSSAKNVDRGYQFAIGMIADHSTYIKRIGSSQSLA